MPDFRKRSYDVEIMDDLQSSGEGLHQALRELETINYLLGGNYVTIEGVARLSGDVNSPSLKIADLGCGSGDMLKRIRKWSNKKGFDFHLIGIDANPNVIEYAKVHTPPECEIEYLNLDIFSEDFKRKEFDVVTTTLFFHHFKNDQLISFIRQLRNQVKIGLIINDIHRHWFAYYSILWLTRIFSKSKMVKNDAPLSVLRAFKRRELIEILEKSGFENYSIKWMWAFRWQVIVWTN